MGFSFYQPGRLVDGDLQLVLMQKIFPEANEIADVPVYKFEMRTTNTAQKLGRINFRVGNTKDVIMYAGHLGYDVEQKYRGNRYAARSCQLLFPLARKHSIDPIWITCNPDNIASRRTCEIAGGKLIEIVDLPPDNDQYQDSERQKCRYLLLITYYLLLITCPQIPQYLSTQGDRKYRLTVHLDRNIRPMD